jgi:fusaric acid resistance family protein
VAVGVPLVGAAMLGHAPAGVAGGATALFVTMSDVGTTRSSRLATMFMGWIAIVLGGTLGHVLGETPYAREAVIVLSAVIAGWASGSYPGIAVVTRFFAVATAASTGMHFADPDVLLAMAVGGASALASVFISWDVFRVSAADNIMDWRAGLRRALQGADADVRFTLCYAAAAATALFAASYLRMQDPFWATLVVLMVMRREGTASIKLTIHYAAGTLVGVVIAAAVFYRIEQPLLLAVLATATAAFTRIGFAVNPALGFMAFTLFLLFVVHVVVVSVGITPHLLETRIFDVAVGCALSLVGTLAATYPRLAPHDAT